MTPFTVVRAFAVALSGVAATASAAPAHTVLIPPSVAPADRAALRASLATVAPHTTVLGDDEAEALLALAAGSGLTCGLNDVDCWQRLAPLGGLDGVVVVDDAGMMLLGAAFGPEVRRATRLQPGDAGVVGALGRALSTHAAIVVDIEPSDAVLLIDGRPPEPGSASPSHGHLVIEGVAPGGHTLTAAAVGRATVAEAITAVAGDVVSRRIVLVPSTATTSSASLSPTLLWSGVGVAGGAVLLGAGLGGIGWQLNGCDFERGCDNHAAGKAAADAWAIPGVVIAGTGIVLGAAAVTSSFFVD